MERAQLPATRNVIRKRGYRCKTRRRNETELMQRQEKESKEKKKGTRQRKKREGKENQK